MTMPEPTGFHPDARSTKTRYTVQLDIGASVRSTQLSVEQANEITARVISVFEEFNAQYGPLVDISITGDRGVTTTVTSDYEPF